ncbi:MAG: UDP-N-acetylmuramoylalanine-D-glutamate ligase [Candidatus Daviesbacteria bacterium GW2011_GWA1_41_61]|uniref:UDP-N-acetylmuramoylalanine--D-glutamate ligase n=1 Tax=Candidatus Daviesbacteria bacterium GW2011_GWA2_40_9 TaxID=1618424 RepID=A0A0G0U465_9BACT|nr:MAG: UDP-N-acetylmuramoylalanine-D-glutamate ligase, UDP-N-acetylmuramoylalanine-D-glutamate ligase [Candidatus Daviesbacteria bacterium GW2011_GWC1_40_9]KKR83864.1 MAG: UDP-N-acetylmuramoylalanine-D-glutamate ligase [Candidatus Daviesbacteria bacterium GW2011_GWA2_40_9]KKR93473.1 MAG: UDP-N-acetylmuramoylalanine-D-glutamate ligase [Candidatus Daviesbacteria bacterium GW2011_GWB1_41_15]KKS14978.1 MAG: UDP-N-acetylmuramoylalanine-D-glutamate ligase [Candidatus Daviesbacteria bacterium GW2011_G
MSESYQNKANILFHNKKVLILGLGINQGGLGATRFFATAGAKVRVTDLKSKEQLQVSLNALKDFPDIEYVLGEHRFEDLDWADLIIKNPALKPDNEYIKYAKEKGKDMELDLGVFLQFVSPQQIIGVTGTKGKSTTASLIYEIIKAGGKEIVFAGNIGKSVFDTIPHVLSKTKGKVLQASSKISSTASEASSYVKKDTLVVLELSSAQLEAFDQHQISPRWAIITNIYPDHINFHGSMENYIEAKKAIGKYQTKEDFLFLKKGDEVTNNSSFINGLRGQITYFSKDDLPQGFTPKLPGEHNLTNMAAALAVAQTLGIEQKTAIKVLENFKGVEFRLQLIYHHQGIKIYNDTAATNPQATIEALQSLPNSILIAGGVNKNLPYKKMAEAVSKYAKAVYFLEGTATDEILKDFPSDKNQEVYNNLEILLKDIKKIVQKGDVILFSPGAASFNLFQNEFDRGRKFNQAVEKIFP